MRHVPAIRANRAPNTVGPEFLNRVIALAPSRPVLAVFQIAGVEPWLAPGAGLEEQDGTNPVNPKWPGQALGGPLKC